MRVNRFSKSGYALFKICPYLCDQVRNHGLKRRVGDGARIGREAHKFLELYGKGKIDREAIKALASDEVYDLVDRAITRDRGGYGRYFRDEQYHELRIKWQCGGVPVTAILDRVSYTGHVCHITDLKTGYDETPDEAEMDVYVAAARENNPSLDYILFHYLWARTGRWTTFLYYYESPHHVRITSPGGYRRDLVSTVEADPLYLRVARYIDEMRNTAPDPRPGPHCTSLYGEPCQLLGNGCPRNPDVATVFAPPAPTGERELLSENLMSLPEDSRPGAAFLAIRDGLPPDQITPTIAGYAYHGVQQLRQGAGSVARMLRQWCESGNTFSVGTQQYGLRPKRITDVESALRLLMANDVPAEDLAKVCSISESSLKRLSKKKYGDLGETIAEACVYHAKDSEFGRI